MTTYQDLEKEAVEEKKLSDEFDVVIQKLDLIDAQLKIMKCQILYLAGSIEHFKETVYDKNVDSIHKLK